MSRRGAVITLVVLGIFVTFLFLPLAYAKLALLLLLVPGLFPIGVIALIGWCIYRLVRPGRAAHR